jgi:hypothetical protein
MPANIRECRPEIDATCTIGSYLLSNGPIDCCLEFLEWSVGALTWDAGNVTFIKERECSSPVGYLVLALPPRYRIPIFR